MQQRSQHPLNIITVIKLITLPLLAVRQLDLLSEAPSSGTSRMALRTKQNSKRKILGVQSWALAVFFVLEVHISLKPIPCNLFLCQSYLKCPPPHSYYLDKKCKAIFHYWKNVTNTASAQLCKLEHFAGGRQPEGRGREAAGADEAAHRVRVRPGDAAQQVCPGRRRAPRRRRRRALRRAEPWQHVPLVASWTFAMMPILWATCVYSRAGHLSVPSVQLPYFLGAQVGALYSDFGRSNYRNIVTTQVGAQVAFLVCAPSFGI